MRIKEHFLTTADVELWQKYLPDSISVYGSLGNARIGERFLGRATRLHVVESETAWISFPMQLRSLSELPFAADVESRWDSATPEFTGPYVFGNDATLIEHYPHIRSSLAQREGIVAEFAHLNPWTGAEQILKDGCSLDREIIWCDTTLEPEFLRRHHLEYRCRKSLSKAERSGLGTIEVTSTEEMRDFVRIYRGTMSRNNAHERYYFTEDYFRAFRELMPLNSRFTLTVSQNQAIGALFILFDDENVYAYLGGNDAAFNHLNPATFQIWDAICWAHSKGKKRLVLGGGYTPNDGIFQFKISFSPLLRPFHVYRKIHRREDYLRLDQASRTFHRLGTGEVPYFPSYRYSPSPGSLPLSVESEANESIDARQKASASLIH